MYKLYQTMQTVTLKQ